MSKFKIFWLTSLFLWGVALVAFNACSNEGLDSTSNVETIENVDQIKKICESSQSEFCIIGQSMQKYQNSGSDEERFSESECEALENALSLYSRTDIETVLEHYGTDYRIYEACIFYKDNIEKDDVFNLLYFARYHFVQTENSSFI